MSAALPASWPSEAEIVAIRASFFRLIPATEGVSFRVYERLFADHPSLRSLFPADMESQQEKLVKMLASAVDLLDDPGAFHAACRELGKRHVQYGALPGHYPVVGMLLLEEVGAAMDPPMPQAEIDLWARLYKLVADQMLSEE
jgi:hemoglobin-like flavoprotein